MIAGTDVEVALASQGVLPEVAGRPGHPLFLRRRQLPARFQASGWRPVGTLWHAPNRIDIGPAVRRGRNTLEIRVANLWVNRLIGDAQPGATRVTFTTLPTYRADAPLRRSGLMGPVTISVPSNDGAAP